MWVFLNSGPGHVLEKACRSVSSRRGWWRGKVLRCLQQVHKCGCLQQLRARAHGRKLSGSTSWRGATFLKACRLPIGNWMPVALAHYHDWIRVVQPWHTITLAHYTTTIAPFSWEAPGKQRLLPSERAILAFSRVTFDWLFQGAGDAFPNGVLRSLWCASQRRFERVREKEQPQEHS